MTSARCTSPRPLQIRGYERSAARRRAERAIELIRRADHQQALVMADDDRGVYGLYPPSLVPN
jgi:hypothetical protein